MLPFIFSALLLAAHFLRASEYGLVALCLAFPFLLFIRRLWVVRVIQVFLLVGSAVWVATAVNLVKMRQELGQPWVRSAVILGCVALFTAASALVFRSRRLRQIYKARGKVDTAAAAAFILAFFLLAVVQVKVDNPLLLLERFLPGWGWMEILFLALYARFISEKMLDPSQSARWRQRLWGLFSVVFFAQLALGLAGLDRFLMTGNLHLPVPAMIVAGPIFRAGRFFMMILFVSTVILVGATWCSHLCYIGAWDAAASSLVKKPKHLPPWRQSLRIMLLILVVASALTLRLVGASSLTATVLGALFGLLGVVAMVVWSRKAGVMTHCVAYCPIGVLANWLGRASPFRMRISEECTECRLCSPVCRYDALNIEDIKKRKPGLSCTLCGDCVGSCKDGWIEYRFLGLKGGKARALFIVLTISLHASFLGVARI